MATSKVAHRNAGAASAEAPERQETHHRRTATVNLPFVTAEFRAPDIHLPSLPVRAPDRSDLSGAVSAIRSHLPSPEQAVYYAGLGLLGVLELIEWPIVLAIGVGTAVAQRAGAARGGAAGAEEQPAEPAGRRTDGGGRRPDSGSRRAESSSGGKNPTE